MTNNLSIKEALEIIKKYSCLEVKNVETEDEKTLLRKAIILVVGLSESENLGICADNSGDGFKSLVSYLNALGYKPNLDLTTVEKQDDPVYIKFNTRNMSHYLDSYTGVYRGVLISCFAEDEEIVGTYGYFPLDLFL